MNKGGMVFYDFDETLAAMDFYLETHGVMDVSEFDDSFFVDVFGGDKRLAQLGWHLESLKERGVDLSIVSFGWSTAIREAIDRVGLAGFFEEDLIFGSDSKLMREKNSIKAKLIGELMQLYGHSFERVIFVDDNRENIEFCEAEKVCQTLHIDHPGGLDENDFKTIEEKIQ